MLQLFDLAGLTCGHFLIPFWTFFGATLIGKAIVKVARPSVVLHIELSMRSLEYRRSWRFDLVSCDRTGGGGT
jgi:hypothetical protein